MKVRDVMTRGVEFVPARSTLQEAATAMAEHDIGAVLVGSPERLEGILTDRDLILRAMVSARDPATTPASEVMSSTVFTCGPDDDAAAALAAMEDRQIRRLPVVDPGDGRVIGIVVRRDLERARRSAPDTVAATTGASRH